MQVVDRNEVMLEESRNNITVPSMFVFRILAYLHRRRRSEISIILWDYNYNYVIYLVQQGQDQGEESD